MVQLGKKNRKKNSDVIFPRWRWPALDVVTRSPRRIPRRSPSGQWWRQTVSTLERPSAGRSRTKTVSETRSTGRSSRVDSCSGKHSRGQWRSYSGWCDPFATWWTYEACCGSELAKTLEDRVEQNRKACWILHPQHLVYLCDLRKTVFHLEHIPGVRGVGNLEAHLRSDVLGCSQECFQGLGFKV